MDKENKLPYSFRIEPELKTKLEQAAKEQKISEGLLIRLAIEKYLSDNTRTGDNLNTADRLLQLSQTCLELSEHYYALIQRHMELVEAADMILEKSAKIKAQKASKD